MGRITKEDRIFIKVLRQEKQWGARRIMKEFPQKMWTVASLSRLLRRIDNFGTVERKQGSGRPRSVRTAANIELVQDLICSQEGRPGTHKTPREIERQTGISDTSAWRIAKYDLKLNTYKRMSVQKLNEDCKIKRLQRCQLLLQRFPNDRSARSVWFTDEKIFTLATPVNAQNDRVYSTAGRKRDVNEINLLREREHFSRSVMVSLGVSRMGKTNVVFIEAGAKVNSQYYCNEVLAKGLLPDIRERCGQYRWTLQQDGAPSHTAINTQQYLQRENISYIEPNMWPPNSPDLNPVDYAIWGALQQLVYRNRSFATVEELKKAIFESWRCVSQAFVDKSINEWRRRLECVVQMNGGHIEHLFQ